MRKRIFLGFKISKDLVNLITRWQQEKDFPDFVRLIKPENLHLTLISPWYESNKDKLALLLSDFLSRRNFPSIEIVFTHIRSAPNTNSPHILWLEGKKNPQLENFREALSETLGLKKEKRELVPHITIARFKEDRSLSYFVEPIFFKEKLKELSIFESKLSRSGASYSIIESFKI